MTATTRGARAVLRDYLREHGLPLALGTGSLLEKVKGTAHEAMVRQLVRQADGPRRERFEAGLQAVLDRQGDPTAREIHSELVARGHRSAGLRGDDVLGGDECRWRREYLLARGWVEQKGTWKPPGNEPIGRHKWGAEEGGTWECDLCGRIRFVGTMVGQAPRFRYARNQEEYDALRGGDEGRRRAGDCTGRRT